MVCTTCRIYGARGEICTTCKGELKTPPYRWSPPKHRDKRAWKRIENGEWLWDRRRVKRRKTKWRRTKPDQKMVYNYETIPHATYRYIKRKSRIEGSGKLVTDYRKVPEVDLGG